ncbi:DUF308 domain-containing protein [Halogranum gelatinilyticum]|nr:DUF308 domain-containing protein [Halogranum gelatinilyticum]
MATTRETASRTASSTTEPLDEPVDTRLRLAVGVITIGIGFFAIAMPLVTGVLVSVWLGLLLIVVGIVRTEALKHRSDVRFGSVAAEVLRASLYVVVGLILLLLPLEPSRLSLVLAIPVVIDGIGFLSRAARVETGPWRSALVGVALVCISVLLVVGWPGSTAVLLGGLFGGGLVLVGAVAVLSSVSSELQ